MSEEREDVLCGNAEMSHHGRRARELNWISKNDGEVCFLGPRWSLMGSKSVKDMKCQHLHGTLWRGIPRRTNNKWLLREKEVRVYLWSHPLYSHLYPSSTPREIGLYPSPYTGDDGQGMPKWSLYSSWKKPHQLLQSIGRECALVSSDGT